MFCARVLRHSCRLLAFIWPTWTYQLIIWPIKTKLKCSISDYKTTEILAINLLANFCQLIVWQVQASSSLHVEGQLGRVDQIDQPGLTTGSVRGKRDGNDESWDREKCGHVPRWNVNLFRDYAALYSSLEDITQSRKCEHIIFSVANCYLRNLWNLRCKTG